MQYEVLYAKLCSNASQTGELHHIIPRSLGGSDDESNLVRLTIKQHFIAHLLLYKMGYTNQIFSIAAMLQDSTNPRSKRYKQLRYKKWLRRHIAYAQAAARREKNKCKSAALTK